MKMKKYILALGLVSMLIGFLEDRKRFETLFK